MKASWSSRSPHLKFVPWSDNSSAGLPLRAMNLLKAIGKESVSRLVKISMCTALVVKHLNRIPHLFSLRRPILTRKGPKQSTPVEKNAGCEVGQGVDLPFEEGSVELSISDILDRHVVPSE